MGVMEAASGAPSRIHPHREAPAAGFACAPLVAPAMTERGRAPGLPSRSDTGTCVVAGTLGQLQTG